MKFTSPDDPSQAFEFTIKRAASFLDIGKFLQKYVKQYEFS